MQQGAAIPGESPALGPGAGRRPAHTAPARRTRNTAPPRPRIPPVVSPPGLATRAPRCRGSRARQPSGAPMHRPCARQGALLCARSRAANRRTRCARPRSAPPPCRNASKDQRGEGGQELKRERRNEHLDKQHPSSAIAARGRRNPILDTPRSARTSRTGPAPATPRRPRAPPQRNASAPPHSPVFHPPRRAGPGAPGSTGPASPLLDALGHRQAPQSIALNFPGLDWASRPPRVLQARSWAPSGAHEHRHAHSRAANRRTRCARSATHRHLGVMTRKIREVKGAMN